MEIYQNCVKISRNLVKKLGILIFLKFKLDVLSTLIFNGATLQFQARQYKKNANANE